MNLRRLDYFCVLAQVGNLRRASEMLHVSPPALSKAMKLLEEEMGVPLWIRDGRRMVLTDAGKSLVKRTEGILGDLRNLKESLAGGPERKPLRIGTFEVFSTYFLGVLPHLGWEDHSLELHELLPGEVEKYCIQGDIDFGITYLPVPDPRLDFLKVCTIEMGVYALKGAFKGVNQKDLPFVVPVAPLQGIPTKMRGLDGWEDTSYRRKVAHRVTLLESALELCRQGKVAGYFPSFIAHEHNKRVKEEFQLERRRHSSGVTCYSDVYIVKRKSSEEGPVVKQLAKGLRWMTSGAR